MLLDNQRPQKARGPLEPKHYAALALTAILIAVGIFDVFAGIYLPPGGSISYLIHDLSGRYPIVPFAAGILCGHLFW
jgi:hypothetical protein